MYCVGLLFIRKANCGEILECCVFQLVAITYFRPMFIVKIDKVPTYSDPQEMTNRHDKDIKRS